MDRNALARDVFELVEAFAASGVTELVHMRYLWLSRGFSFIFEACHKSCVPERFMQTLYTSAMGYISPQYTMPWRLGGFYAMYILYKTQKFPTKFKIYLSLDDQSRILGFLRDAKQMLHLQPARIMKKLMDENAFLFGHTSVTPSSVKEAKERRAQQTEAAVRNAYPRILEGTPAEDHFFGNLAEGLGMDLSMDTAFREYQEVKERVFQVLGNDASNSDGGGNVVEEIRKICDEREEFRNSVVAPKLEVQPQGPMTWPCEVTECDFDDNVNTMNGFADDLDELLQSTN